VEYDLSCRAVCKALEIELEELKDWNCCGASSAHALNKDIDLALSARNISLAHGQELEMAVPCAACYSRTAHAWKVLKEDPAKRRTLEQEFKFQFREDLPVHHLIHVIDSQLQAAGKETPANKAEPEGTGRKIVCYYGCLINRPRGANLEDDMENPQAMNRVLERFGYETLDWSFATECCGAALAMTRDDVVVGLVERIVAAAREAGAEAIATGCPLCQVNLESRQSGAFPIYYFTEIVGAAMGLPEAEKWKGMHLVES